jgi:plastocyanin
MSGKRFAAFAWNHTTRNGKREDEMTGRLSKRWLLTLFACAALAAAAFSGAASPLGRRSVGVGGPLGQSAASAPGIIMGRVYFHGAAPQLRPIVMDKDPICAAEQAGSVWPQDGQVNTNGTLPNAFVYIQSGTGSLAAPAPTAPATLTQKGCMYEPHVLGIMVGQAFEVVTRDPTTHNVHVLPKLNREWNVTQQPGAPPIIRKFDKPEIVIPAHCNIHPWMRAYIAVVSNPYYAVTGGDGSFVLKGVPPGTYTLAVWTATFGTEEKKVTVRPGESSTLDFTFSAP